MKPSLLAVFGVLAAGWACAQDTESFEIRGVVREAGLNTGVASAQITVYQFSKNSERTVFATSTTDGRGNFEFHPTRAGNYYVEAKKTEYVTTMGYQGPTKPLPQVTGSLATVSHDHPEEYVRLLLMRLTELTGRVVDENDKPIERILVEALDPGLLTTQERQFQNARTNRDGSFSIKNLQPGQYIVRISATTFGLSPPATKFSDEDLNAVGQDLETSYWPGVRDASAAGRVTLAPGQPADLGTLRMRKGPLYRVRVSVGGCRSGDELKFSLSAASNAITTLRPDGTSVRYSFPGLSSTLPGCDDFLVRDLAPGSYEFALQSKQGWALTPVEIAGKNLFVTIAMRPEADVTGTVIAAHDDMSLPALGRARIVLEPLRSFASAPVIMSGVAAGQFSFKRIRGPQHAVIVSGLSSGYYIKEIRSDGAVAADGIVTLGPGSHLEVVIDDQPATLTGAVTDQGKPFSQPKVYVSRWPAASRPPAGMDRAPAGTGDGEGRFQITGLPPGEYRVLAVPSGPIPDGAQEWTISPELWDRAERVIVERGKQKEIALKLTDPFLEK